MKNRFKFRAYVKSLKAIFPVVLIDFRNETVLVDVSNGEADPPEYRFDEVVLMQCTEMEDKSGQLAWEGDVIKAHYANAQKAEHIETIRFCHGKFVSEGKLGSGGTIRSDLADSVLRFRHDETVYMDWFEVIGNVHMNPELLEVAQ